jgi:predicted transcriptional regulator of viral defense system
MLLERTKLDEILLRSPHYTSIRRFSWTGEASPIAMAISIMNEKTFFSHASAMWIHGLSDDQTHIFLNNEQSEKRPNTGQLSQEAIDRTFKNQQRRSKLIYKYHGTTITRLSGKHTGRLEVVPAKAPSGHEVEVTSIERTLIDITVRPAYSGGIPAVVNAFKLAKGRVSVTKLLAVLHQFKYVYPYHQCIGFYLKHSGYEEAEQLLAKTTGTNFSFYLSHGLKKPLFDSDWKVFFPRTMKTPNSTKSI